MCATFPRLPTPSHAFSRLLSPSLAFSRLLFPSLNSSHILPPSRLLLPTDGYNHVLDDPSMGFTRFCHGSRIVGYNPQFFFAQPTNEVSATRHTNWH